jgi:hypothetical protein
MPVVKWVNYFSCYVLLEVDPRRLNPQLREPRKLPRLIERFKQGGEIYAPIIVKHPHYNEIKFLDGVHTAIVAIQLGLPTIKIAVLPKEKDFIERLLSEERL